MCEPSWWQLASPVWLFRAKPEDFPEPDGSPCSGPFALRGLTGLLAIHFISFGLPITLWLTVGGSWWLWLLTIPVLLLWAVLVPADIQFRIQKPTRDQRAEYDNHFVNWFGLVTWPILLPMWSAVSVVGLVWWVVTLFV